jgi:hypothetical protein
MKAAFALPAESEIHNSACKRQRKVLQNAIFAPSLERVFEYISANYIHACERLVT